MRFRVVRRFSEKYQIDELTGTAAVGTGPDMQLGATPDTRRRKKLKRQKMPNGRIVNIRV